MVNIVFIAKSVPISSISAIVYAVMLPTSIQNQPWN